MRKGSSKLLKTLTMTLSFVTDSIGGPGNWPLINIPCISKRTNSIYILFILQLKIRYNETKTKKKVKLPFVWHQEDIYRRTWCSSYRICMDSLHWWSWRVTSQTVEKNKHSYTRPFLLQVSTGFCLAIEEEEEESTKDRALRAKNSTQQVPFNSVKLSLWMPFCIALFILLFDSEFCFSLFDAVYTIN